MMKDVLNTTEFKVLSLITSWDYKRGLGAGGGGEGKFEIMVKGRLIV